MRDDAEQRPFEARRRGGSSGFAVSVDNTPRMRNTPPAYLGEPVPDTLSQELMAERVVKGCERTLDKTLSRHRTPRGLTWAVSACCEFYDRSVASMTFTPPLACGPGCVHCCYNPISLTPPEALHLGRHLFTHCASGLLERAALRTQEVCGRIQGLSRTEMGAIRHELLCPLFLDGECAVYPARPLVCRGWNSVNADQCRKSVAEAEPMTMIENHPMPRLLADAVQLGLLRGSRGLNMEAGYLALPRALQLLFEHGVDVCARDWLGGGPFFARIGG